MEYPDHASQLRTVEYRRTAGYTDHVKDSIDRHVESASTLKFVHMVFASVNGPNQPTERWDFWASDALAALGNTVRNFTAPGIRGLHPEYRSPMAATQSELALTVHATDDAVAECREELYVFACVDGQRVATSPNVVDNIFIEDNDRRATLESATSNGNTVTLTFDRPITQVRTPSDPNHALYDPLANACGSSP